MARSKRSSATFFASANSHSRGDRARSHVHFFAEIDTAAHEKGLRRAIVEMIFDEMRMNEEIRIGENQPTGGCLVDRTVQNFRFPITYVRMPDVTKPGLAEKLGLMSFDHGRGIGTASVVGDENLEVVRGLGPQRA